MSKPLVIVESPTKAKTITKYLGGQYHVLSSFGHVRDLPKSKMGVDTEHNFAPTYEVPARSKKAVAALKTAAKDASEILLATDEDREGEAIAWHISEILRLDPTKAKRITFHEITEHAIAESLKHPRSIDLRLVHAQQARRLLDRLVGYELSPLLWHKVQFGLSAGRVQSVAVRLIVERERERRAFGIDEYWTIDAEFEKDAVVFAAKLAAMHGKKLDKLDLKTQADANAIVAALHGAEFHVDLVEKKTIQKAPPPPLTTSTLQMAANGSLGFSAKQTMTLAQRLYETGRITYMRTDSLNLSEKFLAEAQAYLTKTFGEKYAQGARRYKTAKKGAQEAHEAIRPTDPAALPEDLGITDAGERKLYDLIWSRTLASQMPAASLERTSADLEAKGYTFRATGNSITFDGYMKVYRAGKEVILPSLARGDRVQNKHLAGTQHFTEPPPRYSDATLVKALEEFEIGRPSTYAPTITTIVERGYVDRDDNKKLFPTDIAFIVNDLLIEHFPTIVDYTFTARMEKDLDEIADGDKEWVGTLRDFYGPFHEQVEAKSTELTKKDVMKERVLGTDPKTGKEVIVKMGRFGPFVQLGHYDKEKDPEAEKPKSASLLRGMSLDTVTLEDVLALFDLPRRVGTTAQGEEIRAAIGRFGPYLKAGELSATIPAALDPLTINEEQARELLQASFEKKKLMTTPIAELGKDPTSDGEILVKFGRFGPYVTDGKTNVSVPKKLDPAALTREEAIELLIKKRASPKRMFRGKKKKEE